MAPPRSTTRSTDAQWHRRSNHFRLELAPLRSTTRSTDAQRIEGPTTSERKWLLHDLLHGQQMHKASKVPPLLKGNGSSMIYYTVNRCPVTSKVLPLPIGTGSSTIYYTVNKCTRYQR